ncbi:MAG: hypothetical protein ACI3WU_04245 [Phascolarctobacterium sp.]
MKKQAFQFGELRDANDNIIRPGAYGKKTPLATIDNMGFVDYIMNNLDVLYYGLIAGGIIDFDENGDPILPGETVAALKAYVNSAKDYSDDADNKAAAAAGSAEAADASAKAAAGSEANADASAKAAAGSATAADGSAKAADGSAKAAAGSEANADASAKAAASSEANAAGSEAEAAKQANLAKQYKEEMFNGTPDGFAELIDKVDTLMEESIGSFRAINGKIHIKTA